MEEPEDVDMTTSTTLPTLNHDRQDDAMEDGGEAGSRVFEETDRVNSGNNQVSGEQELSADAMDTTPDPSPQPEPAESQQPQLHSDSQHASQENAPAASVAAADTGEGSSSQAPPTPATVLATANNTAVDADESRRALDPASAIIPQPQSSNLHDDSSSVSSDEDALQWHEIIEDTSVPDEQELKEIEECTERSAVDGKLLIQISAMTLLTIGR
jgi:hypothetical protein